jgi:glycine cleavage system H lipoate-binding protein/ABC-type phosphate transport system substrate-binding protein
MKTLFLSLSLVLFFSNSFCNTQKDNQKEVSNSVSVSSSEEIYPLANDWSTKYEQEHPGVRISVEKLNPEAKAVEGNRIYLTTENAQLTAEPLWKMMIGREAIVPIINKNNPLLDKILPRGMTSQNFRQLLTESKQNWGTLMNAQEASPLHLYITDNEQLINRVADFSGTTPQTIREKLTLLPGEVIATVQKDPYAVAFCKLTDVLDAANNQFREGIRILPVDKNSNGRIDHFEDIYGSPEAFTRGVWIGKYPAALCSNIYAAASSKPESKAALDFLTWIQTDGQPLLNQSGFSSLAINERRSNIERLNPAVLAEPAAKHTFPILWTIIAVLALMTPVIWYYSKAGSRKKPLISGIEPEIIPAMTENSIQVPKGLYFDKTHTWAFMEKEGMVRIGIDDFLQHTTGELTNVAMKEPGEFVRKGEKIMTISHNGKKLDIHAPISGTIRERNRGLLFDSTLLNNAPFTEGWVYTIEPKNWLKENHFMFMSEKYAEWLGDEIARLKDFIAMEFKSGDLEPSLVIMQDGGEICDNVLADLDPKVWENFQTKFLNSAR